MSILNNTQQRQIREIARRLANSEELFPKRWTVERKLNDQQIADYRYYMAAVIVGWTKLDHRTQGLVLELGYHYLYDEPKRRRKVDGDQSSERA